MKARRFWLKESRLWTADCVKLVNLGDWLVLNRPHDIPPTEAGLYAMYAASDYFNAYPAAREVPQYER